MSFAIHLGLEGQGILTVSSLSLGLESAIVARLRRVSGRVGEDMRDGGKKDERDKADSDSGVREGRF